MKDHALLRELTAQLRIDSIRAAAEAGSGHPTSSMSAADLMAVLMSGQLRYDFDDPGNPSNDHLVFSKGHASPLLYSMYRAAGAISDEELLTFREFGSRLQGHPTPLIPWVDVATGSLGQGLPFGVGIALAGKRLDRLPYRIWVLCGDSEMAEGSMWEAFEHAAMAGLDNLTAIIDVNRLGQRGETMHGWNVDAYSSRARAFGWNAIEVDGHDVHAIDEAYQAAVSTEGRPTVIVAKTMKGRGVSAVENENGFHGTPLANSEAAIAELGGPRNVLVGVARPETREEPHRFVVDGTPSLPAYEKGSKIATRRAYGEALAGLGAIRGDIVALDAEVSNSTFAATFAGAHPERFFEMYIAEQLMVAAAVGMQVRGWVPFASTFAAFLARAYDFIRMAAVSQANLRLAGSHAGVSIGADGPSQMALEDLAAIRAVGGSTVLYPSDGNQTTKLVAEMADRSGVVYLRTTREATPILYDSSEEFRIGGSRVVKTSGNDDIAICAVGITLHEAVKAAESLETDGIRVRVIDLYSIKPIDGATIAAAGSETQGIVTVEDHWPEGGLGDAVLASLAESNVQTRVLKLAVVGMPGSGTPAELMAAAGIDASHIVQAAKVIAPRNTQGQGLPVRER
ncbi:MAG: transketolase [Dehalococcoidia bacterium]|jgi:transketolase|nr:transketolase [Dehalococcoidia bacterium]